MCVSLERVSPFSRETRNNSHGIGTTTPLHVSKLGVLVHEGGGDGEEGGAGAGCSRLKDV